MSTFKVSVETLSKVWRHPNADKLDLATLDGIDFQFVVGKDMFKAGDKVVYFPIDSILPEQLIKDIAMEGKFSGSAKNRVKTIKLRKEISQGYVEKLDSEKIASWFAKEKVNINALSQGDDLTKLFGVEKFDFEEHEKQTRFKSGHIGPRHLVKHLPGCEIYDIEGVQRNGKALEALKTSNVFITEKVEGTNFLIGSTSEGRIIHGQRSYTIKNWDDRGTFRKIIDFFKYKNPFYKGKPFTDPKLVDSDFRHIHTSTTIGLPNKLAALKAKYFKPEDFVVLRGELLGPSIQKNVYAITEQTIYIFDIQVNGKYVSAADFIKFTKEFDIQTVPVLAYDVSLETWLNGKTVVEAARGKSLVNVEGKASINPDHLREGIVIKPMIETTNDQLHGRLILKHRDADYLDVTGL